MTDVDPFGRGRVRRLFGLDRSGPKPRQTRKGEPLNPWTIPNAVGYLRLAGIPVFLILAYSSGDGRSAAAATIFWLIAAGDYLDGFLARATGQYSRMGALMDPFIDRLTFYLGEVNAVNPFREGNGRTQRAFFEQLARDAGFTLNWQHLDAARNIEASAAIMRCDAEPMRKMLDMLVTDGT